jgi:hypothetical protein
VPICLLSGVSAHCACKRTTARIDGWAPGRAGQQQQQHTQTHTSHIVPGTALGAAAASLIRGRKATSANQHQRHHQSPTVFSSSTQGSTPSMRLPVASGIVNRGVCHRTSHGFDEWAPVRAASSSSTSCAQTSKHSSSDTAVNRPHQSPPIDDQGG